MYGSEENDLDFATKPAVEQKSAKNLNADLALDLIDITKRIRMQRDYMKTTSNIKFEGELNLEPGVYKLGTKFPKYLYHPDSVSIGL